MESCIYYYYWLESLSVLNNHIIKLSDFRIKRLNVGGKKTPEHLLQGPEETSSQPEEEKKIRLNDCLQHLHEQKSPEIFLNADVDTLLSQFRLL